MLETYPSIVNRPKIESAGTIPLENLCTQKLFYVLRRHKGN